MEISIRSATNDDIPTIRALVYSVLNEYGLQPDASEADKDLEDIMAYYQHNGGYFGVLEREEKIIASVGLYRRSDSTCELRKMYMLSEFRGLGYGKKLLQFSIQKAKDLGFSHIILETASPLKEAIKLYQHYGFREYQTENLVTRCDKAFILDL